MIRPLESRFPAHYYDGDVPARYTAEVEILPDALHITLGPAHEMLWPYSSIRFASDGSYGEPVRMENSQETPHTQTLVVESRDFIEALRQHGIARRPPLDLRSWQAVALCLVAIAVIGASFYTWGVAWAAEQGARLMPAWMEDRLGRSVLALLAPEEMRCKNSAGLSPVINRLLVAAGPGYNFTFTYVDSSIVNAFAAPGGYVVVFRGLLDRAQTPEEFAGVLAHEMQHVILRHSTRAIAREFSGQALLALMAIDSSGTPAAIQAGARLANLSYQRDDEEAADLSGVSMLSRAAINPDGLAQFLRSIQFDLSEPATSYLSSHPATQERIETIRRRIADDHTIPEPIMSQEDWNKARRVCDQH